MIRGLSGPSSVVALLSVCLVGCYSSVRSRDYKYYFLEQQNVKKWGRENNYGVFIFRIRRDDAIVIVIIACHPTMCSMSFNVDHS